MKRIIIHDVDPEAYTGMFALENYIKESGFSPKLKHLIKIRASELNGCAYCVDMHTQEALADGESQRRIFAIATWKESPLFTEEERALLQLTDEVTFISKDGVSDETYNNVVKFYGEKTFVQIMMVLVAINSWNRLAISTKQIFEPAAH
ncbi:MAG: carboxymuconolactone decarboxylase family protein [Ginsengibacter sp.]